MEPHLLSSQFCNSDNPLLIWRKRATCWTSLRSWPCRHFFILDAYRDMAHIVTIYFWLFKNIRVSKLTILKVLIHCTQGVNFIDYSNLSFCFTLYLFVLLCHRRRTFKQKSPKNELKLNDLGFLGHSLTALDESKICFVLVLKGFKKALFEIPKTSKFSLTPPAFEIKAKI